MAKRSERKLTLKQKAARKAFIAASKKGPIKKGQKIKRRSLFSRSK